MAVTGLRCVVSYLSRTAVVQQNGKFTDAELLGRYADRRDTAAFEVLVWRHGAMVLNVCSRVTRCEQDTEDGFQATFLTLANKAGTIGRADSVASWLYRVAFRAALELKRKASRTELSSKPQQSPSADPLDESIARELDEILHQEVVRLPEKYRLPILLSSFQGRTNQEIARVLQTAEATVRTRLARAREQLRTRLDQRGIQAPALLLALGQGSSTVPPTLVSATIDLALDFTATAANSTAAAWAAGRVQQALFVQKVRTCVAAAVLLLGFGGVAGLSLHSASAARTAASLSINSTNELGRPENPEVNDAKNIIGTWERTTKVTRTTKQAGEAPKTKIALERERWVITADRIFLVGEDGFVTDEYRYKLNPKSAPKAIDLLNQRFGTLLCIYQLDQDLLLVCRGSLKVRSTQADMALMPAELALRRVSREPAQVTHRYQNAPGCFWMVQPSHPAAMSATLGITYLYDVDKDGAGVLTLGTVVPAPDGKKPITYRPVLFDKTGQRYLPTMETGGMSALPEGPGVALHRYRTNPTALHGTNVAALGIEAVTSESVRLTAKEAAERAAGMNLEVLPWPEAGKPFPVHLTTMDGQKLLPEKLRGKVVIVDCWASWCGPCMAKLPEMNRFYEQWHKDGLEIIGVNLDQDPALVRRICQDKKILWPQVMAPVEAAPLEIWRQCAGLDSIPRIFLIDRTGNLRTDTVANIEEEILKLMNEKPTEETKP